ncbi:MAG: hypothetical protein Q7U97_07650 [Rhodocyclaceae bacterium]|nr:hypothetical protein [Rhodocyclaceae bacterium]
MSFSCRSSRLLVGILCIFLASLRCPAQAAEPVAEAGGIRFDCPAERLPDIAADMVRYLVELEIPSELYTVSLEAAAGKLRFTLATPPDDTNTLDFNDRPEFGIPLHIDWMPTDTDELRNILTVTDKEIVLALMQHGRLTEFSGAACTVDALRDHVGIRQNIVAWAENLEWGWPDGGPARWNRKYWKGGSLKSGIPLRQAVSDAFFNQDKYEIGCYTATKLVVIQGILDYFHRIKGDAARARLVEDRLIEDGEPLVDIEPGRMWSFEPDFDPRELDRPGKILRIAYGIAPKNFVPGDWSYFLNTDPVTYRRCGYEGSNPIYLGRNRFVDYYNDHDHFYTFEEKLDEVYQWRNQVFNRSRDRDKVVPLSPEDFARLAKSPEEGGLVTTLRTTPYYFGFEKLPAIRRGAD